MRKRTQAISAWLWDLLPVRQPPGTPGTAGTAGAGGRSLGAAARKAERSSVSRDSAKARYEELVALMKQEYCVRVRRWRTSNSGCAWQVMYVDGTVSRLIEAPYPRGPVSCAVFLHEVGHHAIGFHRYKLRCLEEYMAWRWALDQMRVHEIPITPQVERLVNRSIRYAVAKAKRRGLKKLPRELQAFVA